MGIPKRWLRLVCAVLSLAFSVLHAQKPGTDVPVLLLSDFHFDPFHDPGKTPALLAAPVDQWDAILEQPASPDQGQKFQEIQKACKARGVDTPHVLMESSLAAAKAQSTGIRFVTVSGDLLVHTFDCRYQQVFPGADTAAIAAFAAKTEQYVMGRIEREFPGIPVYIGLGNNDVGCGNAKIELDDQLFRRSADALLQGLVGASRKERQQVLKDYDEIGSYTVSLNRILPHTRLIVLDNTFMIDKNYRCTGSKEFASTIVQIAWLTRVLDQARAHGEKVWLVGHIPPSIDTYDTFGTKKNICTDGEIKRFLRTDELGDLLTRYAGEIKLAIFAHSHMDELRLLPAGDGGIPMKLVASVSGFNGNLPTFTVGVVDRKTAVLKDYAVYEGSNMSGLDEQWTRKYDFDQTYHEPDFSPQSLAALIGRLTLDPMANTNESKAMKEFYALGVKPSVIDPVWPQYVCELDHYRPETFKACSCAAPAAGK